jgi:hypothetical protein
VERLAFVAHADVAGGAGACALNALAGIAGGCRIGALSDRRRDAEEGQK